MVGINVYAVEKMSELSAYEESFSIGFETSHYLVVRCGDRVLRRCAIALTDLDDDEALDSFVTRHSGNAGTLRYLREVSSHRFS